MNAVVCREILDLIRCRYRSVSVERLHASTFIDSDLANTLTSNDCRSWSHVFKGYQRVKQRGSRQAFNQSVYRFKRRLLREIVWICTATDIEESPLASRELISAYYAAAVYLLRNGHSDAGAGILQYAASIAKRYQESALLAECLKELVKRASYENDRSRYRKWTAQLSVAMEHSRVHFEIEQVYASCMLGLHDPVPASTLRVLTTAFSFLEKYDWRTVPYPALLQMWRCQIWYYQYAGEYANLIKTSRRVLSWYRRNPVFATNSRLVEFRTNELSGLLLSRQTEKAWRLVQSIEQTATEADSAWLSFVDALFVHSITTMEFAYSIRAYVLYEQSETGRLPVVVRQQWIFYRVCLRFLADFGYCVIPEDSKLNRAIYPKTLHSQMSELCVSTLPYGFAVEIIYLLTLIRLNRLDEVLQREAYIKRQILRKLRASSGLDQFRCVFEAIAAVIKQDFSPKALASVREWEGRCPVYDQHSVSELSIIPPQIFFEILKQWLENQ